MRNVNEVEAAELLGEVARHRRAAGLRGLGETDAAWALAAVRSVRALPGLDVPEQRSKVERLTNG